MSHVRSILRMGVLVVAGIGTGATAQLASQTRASSVFDGGTPSAVAVEVFSNGAIPLSRTGTATVYLLDGLQLLEAELSAGLPGDEAQAQQLARERMRRLGPQLQQRVSNAAKGLTLARQYGIERVPAVVIDGSAIVYGVTDVEQAVALYLERRGGKR